MHRNNSSLQTTLQNTCHGIINLLEVDIISFLLPVRMCSLSDSEYSYKLKDCIVSFMQIIIKIIDRR